MYTTKIVKPLSEKTLCASLKDTRFNSVYLLVRVLVFLEADMADGKQWFKIWTSILTDPHLSSLHNQSVGCWLRLCALMAQHGNNGILTIPQNQLIVTLHLINASQKEIDNIFNELVKLKINISESIKKDNVTDVTLQILNWQKYQAFSDSYERVMKHRKAKSNRYISNGQEKRREEKRKEEKRKEENKRNITPKGVIADIDFLKALKENPAYKEINIDHELAKMDSWFLTPKGQGRKKTRRFIVNWLNKIDKPMEKIKRAWEV